MDLAWLISIGTFLSVILVSVGIYAYQMSREEVLDWRRRVDHSESLVVDGGSQTWVHDLARTLTALIRRVGEAIKPKNEDEIGRMRSMLLTAGYRSQNAVFLFIGARLVAAVVTVLWISVIPAKVLGFPSTATLLMFYTGSALVGYYLPNAWLYLAVRHRKHKILSAVPDALDLLVVCVEAGLGLDMAIARVADEMKFTHKELGSELNILAFELRTGIPRSDALRNLARRTNLEDVKTLVALLVQTDRFGTSIGQALRVHADAMRVTRQLRAEARAAKLPVKLLFPLILFIFPSLFVVIMGPAAIKIIRVLFPVMQGVGQG